MFAESAGLIAVSLAIFGCCLTFCFIGRRQNKVVGEPEQAGQADDYAALLLDSVQDAVLGVAPDGTVDYANSSALNLLGYRSTAELIGRDAREILHQTGADCLRCPGEKCRIVPVFATGMPQLCENELLWRRDGSSFNAELSCTPLWSGDKLRGALLTFRDVSERREVLERLRLQGAALEAASNSILIADRSHKIIWVNQGFTKLTGYAMEEAVGQNPVQLLSGLRDEQVLADLWSTINSKKSWHGEVKSSRRDGTVYDDDVTITPVLDQYGAITHFLGISRDITGRKQSEQALLQANLALDEANRQLVQTKDRANDLALRAERASAAKSEFLVNMRHDILMPLNGILGAGSLLRDTELSEPQFNYLEGLSISAEALYGIVTDILDFSEIEAGQLVIESVEFAPEQVIGDLLAPFAARAAERGIELRTQMDRSIPAGLVGDPRRLSQVIGNLLDNALKFTKRGCIACSVAVVRRSTEGAELEFCVRDSGVGIRPEDQEHLFQAFSQLDGHALRNCGGTGLGLAISKRLTNLMGGEIWYESQPGLGSTFTFRLSFGLAAGASARAYDVALSQGEKRFSGERVLLVEDNVFNQQVAIALLEAGGLQVTLAQNGLEAVQMVAERDFDLVLMDIHMPVMDGLTAARQIRKLAKPDIDTLPILAVSADRMEQDVKAILGAGMNAHLPKPYTLDALYGTISLWMGRSRGAAHLRVVPDSVGKKRCGEK
jgi:PAS domain S-box-containing protein